MSDDLQRMAMRLHSVAYESVNQALTLHNGSPWVRMLVDRISTPIPGDFVIEMSSFYRPDLDGLGTYLGRLYDLNLERQPPDQAWEDYLWVIKPIFPSDKPSVNWTNCRVLVVPDNDLRKSLDNTCGRGLYSKPDCMDEKTWWWREEAEKYKTTLMARAAKESAEQPEAGNG